jgi:hypothetical protein
MKLVEAYEKIVVILTDLKEGNVTAESASRALGQLSKAVNKEHPGVAFKVPPIEELRSLESINSGYVSSPEEEPEVEYSDSYESSSCW